MRSIRSFAVRATRHNGRGPGSSLKRLLIFIWNFLSTTMFIAADSHPLGDWVTVPCNKQRCRV
jgi:hypothetical protein